MTEMIKCTNCDGLGFGGGQGQCPTETCSRCNGARMVSRPAHTQRMTNDKAPVSQSAEQDVALAERMTRNPTLRPTEYPLGMALIKRKKKHIAGCLGITPETLSRIIAGRPASKPVEKLFRLLVICESMPDETPQELKAKWSAMLQVVSLDLSPMEIVS